jgi:hypothetical protein
MNKDLKNRGLNAPVIFIAVVIIGVLIGSAFVEGNAIYDASIFDKVLGYGLLIAGGLWAAKSGDWFSGMIENDRVLLWVQILGTMAILAIGFTILIA